MHPKRWLAIVAVVVVLAVAVVVFPEKPNDDPPRLSVLRRGQENGQQVVVFRFDAPRYRDVLLDIPRIYIPASGIEKPMNPAWDSAVILLSGN